MICKLTHNTVICATFFTIRGLRIRVIDILDMLAEGASRADILESYPELEDEDITAALAYARRAIDHRVIAAE